MGFPAESRKYLINRLHFDLNEEIFISDGDVIIKNELDNKFLYEECRRNHIEQIEKKNHQLKLYPHEKIKSIMKKLQNFTEMPIVSDDIMEKYSRIMDGMKVIELFCNKHNIDIFFITCD